MFYGTVTGCRRRVQTDHWHIIFVFDTLVHSILCCFLFVTVWTVLFTFHAMQWLFNLIISQNNMIFCYIQCRVAIFMTKKYNRINMLSKKKKETTFFYNYILSIIYLYKIQIPLTHWSLYWKKLLNVSKLCTWNLE